MDNLEPSKPNRKKFDMDLKYGKVRERLVAEMLQDKRLKSNLRETYGRRQATLL